MNFLLDKNFLYELNQYRHKEIYARIIALTFDERPLETIEGRVTSGSINIDGNSAVRRTCNLSLIAKDVNITDFYWGVSNKFTLEIGVKNNINSKYPELIWFKQGIYVISSFNCSLTGNNYSISIGGKDKMCLLNGDVGGNIQSPVDFGVIDIVKDVFTKVDFEDFSKYTANKYYILQNGEYNISTEDFKNNITYYSKDSLVEQKKLTIKEIILEAVHTYGKEAYQNIVINDLDECGLEMVQYRGDVPLYLLYNEDAAIYDNMTIDDNLPVYEEIEPEKYTYTEVVDLSEEKFYENPLKYFLFDKEKEIYYQNESYNNQNTYFIREIKSPIINQTSIAIKDIQIFNNAIDNFNEQRTIFYLDKELTFDEDENRLTSRYSATTINKGHDAGYKVTELTYAGDLVASIGESLTSILDKIKNMLGAFEYFYDLDGKFIFQAKKIYSNQSWNSLVDTDGNIFARDAIEDSPYSYSFEDVNLIQQITNTPAINNIKNDYSIWGVRKSVTGQELPIHARYAIDKKPIVYTSININEDEANELMRKYPDRYLKLEKTMQTSKRYEVKDYDWREILYRMALDYYKYGQLDNFTYKLINANKADNLYLSGSTGYEHYYIDLQGFWRQLYNPEPEIIYDTEGGFYTEEKYYKAKELTENEFTENKNYYYTYDEQSDKFIPAVDLTYQQCIESNEFSSGEIYYIKTDENEYVKKEGLTKEEFDLDKSSYYYQTQYYTIKVNLALDNTHIIQSTWNPFKEKETFTSDYFLKGEDDNQNYSSTLYYWHKNVVQAPELLNFWFDFYEGDDSLQQYQVSYIGDRSKVVNNSKITSVYFRNVPQIIFVLPNEDNELDVDQRKTGYTYIFLPDEMADLFSISTRGKSAEEEMTELFNQHSYCTESISITTIPIYHLEPNSLIHIRNDENNLNGKYEITRITIPLTYNGMMSISATKVIDIV